MRPVRIAELAATKASINEKAARGNAPGEDAEPIQRLERPKGEAGDGKNGFNLQNAMGLEDDDEKYQAIMRSVHHNVVRANVDFTVDFRRQDPAKLAAVYKLVRDQETRQELLTYIHSRLAKPTNLSSRASASHSTGP